MSNFIRFCNWHLASILFNQPTSSSRFKTPFASNLSLSNCTSSIISSKYMTIHLSSLNYFNNTSKQHQGNSKVTSSIVQFNYKILVSFMLFHSLSLLQFKHSLFFCFFLLITILTSIVLDLHF